MGNEPTTARPLGLGHLFVLAGLIILTQLGQSLYVGLQLAADRSQLEARGAAQEQLAEEVAKVRAQLESLAAGTARLAEQGNANAKALLERLKAQGVTLRAPAKQ